MPASNSSPEVPENNKVLSGLISSPNSFRIANPEHVKSRVAELSRRSEDIKSRLAGTLKKLWNPDRNLAPISNLASFLPLRTRFPNFSEAIDLFDGNAIGLSMLGLPLEVTHILLLGEPGLGKTKFVSELAKVLQLPYFELSLATITSSFVLSGGDLQWD